MQDDGVEIRPYRKTDAARVSALFVAVNRALAPPELRERFEAYIDQSIAEEIGRVDAYYAARGGAFWVAEREDALIGMVGLEADGSTAYELRRMYVAPEARRRGLALRLLDTAEGWARRRGAKELTLSTSELQQAAIAFYEAQGFILTGEVVAAAASNKTIGGGVRRREYARPITPAPPAQRDG